MPGVLPEDLIEAYCELRQTVNTQTGWASTFPYMQHNAIKNLGLYRPVMQQMEDLIGDRMGMHLNLTGWVSTERNWHQDEYLNPPQISSWYCAAWFALDDIHPDSGPFQYVPGSHRWGIMRMEKTRQFLSESEKSDPNWPKLAERFVDKACEEEIERRGVEVVTYIPKKGDVLLWHARLLHRGSKPRKSGMLRKSFIAHYSGLSVRSDMQNRKEHDNGFWYFVF
jgi:ectoine hydroxylase-related dioxygenase (phytanoyl-CoA dioxygenase family)